MLKKIWDKITGKYYAEKMVHEFAEAFPGRCFICAYHRFGVTHGLTSGPVPEHDCIETALNNQPQPCGHPRSAIVSDHKGVRYCETCEREARKRWKV